MQIRCLSRTHLKQFLRFERHNRKVLFGSYSYSYRSFHLNTKMSFKTTERHTMLAQCHLPCSAQTNPLFPFEILSGVFHHCRHIHTPLTYFHNSAEVHYCTLCSAANDVNQQATERERAHRDGDVARHKRSRYISTKGLVPLMGLFCSDALISRHDMRSVSVRENCNNATTLNKITASLSFKETLN